jgi:hypothetical protein
MEARNLKSKTVREGRLLFENVIKATSKEMEEMEAEALSMHITLRLKERW